MCFRSCNAIFMWHFSMFDCDKCDFRKSLEPGQHLQLVRESTGRFFLEVS